MKEELIKLLEAENKEFDAPYDKNDDLSAPDKKFTRKKVLKLCDINKLKQIRNQQREEIAQDSVFVPILYGTPEANDQGGMGMM